MQPRVRFWEALALGGLLVVAAVIFQRPILLVGVAGIAAWLVGMQAAFMSAIGRFDRDLTVEQTVVPATTAIDRSVSVIVETEAPTADLDATVRARPSPGIRVSGATEARVGEPIEFEVDVPAAGMYRLRPPEVTVTDRAGLFTERFTRGSTETITVEEQPEQTVHIGQGGEDLTQAFGDHPSKATGSGLVPAKLRKYEPSTSALRIDWKATARLTDTYVREFETEKTIETVFVVDQRAHLGMGREDETPLDYLRAAALGYLGVVQELRDPIGCYLVGDGDATRVLDPTSSDRGYELVQRRLHGLRAEAGHKPTVRPTSLRRRGATALDPATGFGRTLRPYVDTQSVADLEDPFLTAVRMATRNHGEIQLVLFTDDADRTAIRDAVATAHQENHTVLVFLTPTVLFEPGGLADLESAYERYREFERFRRNLSRNSRVHAFEVAPRARIETILRQARTRRTA